MICPQCGYRNAIGATQCASCRRPFTRVAAQTRAWHANGQPARQPASTPVVAELPLAVATSRPRRRRSAGGCVLTLLVGLALTGVLGWLVLTQIVQPRVGDMAVAGIRNGVRATVQERIAADLQGMSAGEVTITDQEITDRLNANGNLGPIDNVQVHITPNGLSVDLAAYGVSGTYHATIAEQDGAVVLANGRLGGPLSYAVPDGELEQAINRELAEALAAAGYHVAAVTLGNGALTLALISGS